MQAIYKRVAVKVGSNVLTCDDGTLDIIRMSSIVNQIATLRSMGVEVVLISSGAVASGRSEMSDNLATKHIDTVEQRQLFSAVGQVKLINHYYEMFRKHGITVGQVLTMKECFSTRSLYLNQRNCMMVMLDNGVLPIVNENDTTSVTELMFTDNDELSGLVATMLAVQALIILSNVDGVYDGVPGTPGVNVIRNVEPGRELSEYIQATKSNFGRGGMMTKCGIARKVAEEGIAVYIANGKRDNILTDIVTNPKDVVSTCFSPAQTVPSPIKKWIAHSTDFTKGCLHLNEKAVSVVCGTKAVSVLPVGVVRVDGDFEKDDIVALLDVTGKQIGVGRVACSANEARSVIGQHGQRPLVHYDYLYIEN